MHNARHLFSATLSRAQCQASFLCHPLEIPRPDWQGAHGARTPSSASLFMTDSVVWAGKKTGGKKMEHSPANDPFVAFCHPLEIPRQDSQGAHGARTPSSASLFMTDSVVWAGKKMGGKKIGFELSRLPKLWLCTMPASFLHPAAAALLSTKAVGQKVDATSHPAAAAVPSAVAACSPGVSSGSKPLQ